MSHTPGPWRLESVTTKAGRNKYALSVANFRICDIRVFDDRDEANARLIAAAPDLLAALEQIASADTIGGISAGERKGLQRAATTARAAIAAMGKP